MDIKPETFKLLRQLAAKITTEPGLGEAAGGRWGAIPATLLPSPAGALPSKGTPGFRLTIDETRLYQDCCHALAAEPELEHLVIGRKKEREVEQPLWELVCDLFVNREKYKDSGRRNERLRVFVSEITVPHEDYEVIFNVDHLSMDEGELAVGCVTFFRLDDQRALAWGVPEYLLEGSVAGKTVGRVRVRAGSSKTAVPRAKEKIDSALSVLRVCGAPMRLIHDSQLQQRRGQHHAVKKLSRSDGCPLGGWERGLEPFDLELQGAILDHFSEEMARLQPILDGAMPRALNDRLLRALEWVSASITRERDDDKVVDLCTALEALLTTQDDRRKGEALALRVLLVGMAAERGGLLLHPLQVLHLYELRSKIVHGSARNVCEKRHYRLLRYVVLDAMQDVITVATSNQNVTTVSKLIIELQQKARLQEAIAWLKQTCIDDAKESKGLIKYADECVVRSRTEPVLGGL